VAVFARLSAAVDYQGYSAWSAEVLVQDTGTQAEFSSFSLEGPLFSVALHGSEILVQRGRKLDAYSLEGAYLRTIVEVPHGRLLLGAAVSPDGARLAYIHSPDGPPTLETIRDTQLDVIAIASGDTLLGVGQDDPVLERGFRGQMYDVAWGFDGGYMVVGGTTHSDSPAPFAVIDLGGSIHVLAHDTERQVGTVVEPQGRLAAIGFEFLGGECYGEVDKEGRAVSFPLSLIGLPSADPLAEATLGQPPYAALWSPDGDILLFAHRDCEDEPEERWFTWSVGDDAPRSVDDPIELWRGWYGDRAVLAQREDGTLHLPDMWRGAYVIGRMQGDSFVVGDSSRQELAGADALLFLGFVD